MLRRIAGFSALALVLSPFFALAADFPLSEKNTTITFVGSKPNGKHEGGFKSVTGTASVTGTDAATLRVSLDIDMNSLFSDNDKLTSHLKAPDFFAVKSNPKSTFVSTKVEKAGNDYKITGNLTMIGKTKEITFPAKIAVSSDGVSLTSSFSIDRTQWGMTYGQGKIDDAVKLTVSIKSK